MTRTPIKSTNIAAIGYDPATQALEVAFRPTKTGEAAVWLYADVAPHDHYELVTADSIGRAFAAIKASRRATKVAIIDAAGVERAIDERQVDADG